jgi:hypothetical protein
MPRFSARNAIILFNVCVLLLLLSHLKYHLWDKDSERAGVGASSLFTDIYGDEEDGYGGGKAKDRDAILGLDGVRSDNEFRSKEGKILQVNGITSTSDAVLENKGKRKRTTAVVVASQASENATWIGEAFPKWQQNIYRVDDPDAPLTVPKNKGKESMVYLTYVLLLLLCVATCRN